MHDDDGVASGANASSAGADHNLLFGVIALQNDFITREQLVASFDSWVHDKSRGLADILQKQGALSTEDRGFLDRLVEKFLAKHGGDAEKSLAALSAVSRVRPDLERLNDPDLAASLGHVGQKEPPDPHLASTLLHVSGTPLGRFRILRPHAKGGLGQVSVALDQELNREVALKEIQPQHADDVIARERFVVEAEITGGLEHPGIVPVYALGQGPDGRPFYAMRFVRGDSLKQAIEVFHNADNPNRKDSGARQLALRQLLGRFIDVCNAIEYAHSRGVLHRDLKPGNIMVGKYGETLVVDWGLAKSVGKKVIVSDEATLRPASTLSSSGQTRPGSAIGTPAYMSPEQAAGKLEDVGPASDVYSLGATLYHVLCGKPPFEKDEHSEIVAKVQRGDFPKPRSVTHDVPAALEAICLKAMALKPADRYQTARALADDLEHWLADEPVTAAPDTFSGGVSRLARKHRGYVRAGGVAVIVIAIVSVMAAIQINRSREAALELAGKNERLAERNGQLADDERQSRELAQESAENETKARQRAEGLQRESVAKTLEAYDSLAQAALAQSHALATAKQLGRQVAALEVLEQAGSLRRKSLELISSIDDRSDGQASITASKWDEYLPLLRGEAVRWMAQSSLQNLKTYPFPFDSFGRIIAISPDGNALARYARGENFLKGEIRVFDAMSGAVKGSLPLAWPLFPKTMAISKDGHSIVICSLQAEHRRSGWEAGSIQIHTRSFPEFRLLATRRIVVDEEGLRLDLHDNPGRFFMGDDLQYFVMATRRGSLAWDINSGRRVFRDLEFSATSTNRRGSVMVGPSPPHGVRIVEIDSGEVRDVPQPDKVAGAWISPDGRHLMLELEGKGNEHKLQLVDAETGEPRSAAIPAMQQYSRYEKPVCAFHPDGTQVAAVTSMGMLLISLPDGKVLWSQRHPHPSPTITSASQQPIYYSYTPLAVSFSSRGGTLVSCLKPVQYGDSANRELVDVWDSTVGSIPSSRVTTTAAGRVNGVCLAGENQIIIGSDGGVTMTELAGSTTTWSTPKAQRGHSTSGSRTLSGFDPTGQYFVEFLPKRVVLWENSTGSLVGHMESYLPGQDDPLPGCKDLGWLLVKTSDEEGNDGIGIFRPHEREHGSQSVIRLRDFGKSSHLILTVSDDGRFVAFASPYGQDGAFDLQIVRMADGQVVTKTPRSENTRIEKVLFARDRARALVLLQVGGKSVLHVLDLKSGEQLAQLRDLDVSGYGLRIEPHGKFALMIQKQRASDSMAFAVGLWSFDKPESKCLATDVDEYSPHYEFSPDGTSLVMNYRRKKKGSENDLEFVTELWDVETPRLVASEIGRDSPKLYFAQSGPMAAFEFAGIGETPARLELRNLRTGNVLRSWADSVTSVSPDGRYLLLSRGAVISAATGETWIDAQDSSKYTIFSPDSRILATRGDDGNLRLWNIHERLPVPVVLPAKGKAVFSPDGKWLGTHDETKSLLQIWATATGELTHVIPILHENRVEGLATPAIEDLAFSNDGQFAGFTCRGQTRLMRLNQKKVTVSLPRAHHAGPVASVSISPDGRDVATASSDQSVCFWDAVDGRFLGMLEAHADAQRRVAFSSDGLHLMTRGAAGQCVVWRWKRVGDGDATTIDCAPDWTNDDAPGEAAMFGPGGTTVALGDADGTVRLLDVQFGKLLHLLKRTAPPAQVRALAFSPSGDHLAVAGDDGDVAIWHLADGNLVQHWAANQGVVGALTFTPNGRLLISAGGDVRFFDVESRSLLLAIERHALPVLDVAFDSTGEWLTSVGEDKTVSRINVRALAAELGKLGLGWDDSDFDESVKKKSAGSTGEAGETLWRVATESEIVEYTALAHHRGEARRCEQGRNWKEAIEHLDRLVRADPGDGDLSGRRAWAHAELANWDEAERDFAEAARRKPDNPQYLWNHALTLLGGGKNDAYRIACAEIQQGETLNQLFPIWLATVAPDMITDVPRLLKVAESAVQSSPHAYSQWEQLGSARFRAGRNDEARQALERAVRIYGGEGCADDLLLLAMCCYRLKQTADAQRYLKTATEMIEQADTGFVQVGTQRIAPTNYVWWQRLSIAILRREAEEMIRGGGSQRNIP